MWWAPPQSGLGLLLLVKSRWCRTWLLGPGGLPQLCPRPGSCPPCPPGPLWTNRSHWFRIRLEALHTSTSLPFWWMCDFCYNPVSWWFTDKQKLTSKQATLEKNCFNSTTWTTCHLWTWRNTDPRTGCRCVWRCLRPKDLKTEQLSYPCCLVDNIEFFICVLLCSCPFYASNFDI